jgi:gliding motility-associated lipoprotein GldH
MSRSILFTTAFIAFSILAGCSNKDLVFSDFQSFGEDYEWKKDDKKTFVIEISDNSRPLEFVLLFRYATGYMYDKMLVRITETDPRGNRVMRDMDVHVRDPENEFIGEKGYDIIDLEQVIDANKKYPEFGKYTYTIEHIMPVDPVNFAMGIGLELREQKQAK